MQNYIIKYSEKTIEKYLQYRQDIIEQFKLMIIKRKMCENFQISLNHVQISLIVTKIANYAKLRN